MREAVASERGLEGRGVGASHDGGAIAVLHEERRGKLGEIARRVAAEKEERAVAFDGCALSRAARRELAAEHALQDAEIAVGGGGGELGVSCSITAPRSSRSVKMERQRVGQSARSSTSVRPS